MSDQQPSKTPRTDEACRNSHDGAPSVYVMADFARQLETELSTANAENELLRQKCFADDCDSVVASCNCLTKSPEVQHHKKGCKYRLITERDSANAEVERLKAENEKYRTMIGSGICSAHMEPDPLHCRVCNGYELYKHNCGVFIEQRDTLLANSKALADAISLLHVQESGAEDWDQSNNALAAHNKLMEQFK